MKSTLYHAADFLMCDPGDLNTSKECEVIFLWYDSREISGSANSLGNRVLSFKSKGGKVKDVVEDDKLSLVCFIPSWRNIYRTGLREVLLHGSQGQSERRDFIGYTQFRSSYLYKYNLSTQKTGL